MSFFMNQYFGLVVLCVFIALGSHEIGDANCRAETSVVKQAVQPAGPPECVYFGKLESQVMETETDMGQKMLVQMPVTHAWTCPNGTIYVK